MSVFPSPALWKLLAHLQRGQAEMGHLPRVCACGLVESRAAWDAGNQACPRCGAAWPQALQVLVLDPEPAS